MKQFKKAQVIRADDDPDFDKELADKIIGKYIIVGYTFYRSDGSFDRQEQKHGIVKEVNEKDGVCIQLHNSDEIICLPPDFRSWEPAEPGTYTLHSTGEEVIDPDYFTTWVVHESS